jgi:iron complex outermembrane receptor protein
MARSVNLPRLLSHSNSYSVSQPQSPIETAAKLAASIAAGAAFSLPLFGTAVAQTAVAAPTQQLEPVTVTGRSAPALNVGGWGDIPLNKTPLQASVFSAEQIKDAGAQRLSDLIGFDPGISDAYNSEGYYDFLTVRGFVIDNRFNYRRDGLPINAETAIPLDNKSRVEILKGTSGMQAGTSAPGGLVNFVVKRPTDAPVRSAALEWRQPGTVTAALDLGQRFGEGQAFGVRLNAAAAHLDPMVRSDQGNRSLFALAADWRLSADSLLEAEFETSHRAQPSQPGFSLLGNNVPPPSDPRINLNNQPWSLPVVFDANTASLRWQQKLAADWHFTAHVATQQLRTDDRVAFPFGCSDPNPAPNGTYYADRYCPNGNFDLYDFRSENERRRTNVIDLSVQGQLQTGLLRHSLTTGVQQSKVRNRFQQQAYNYVGTGNVDGTAVTAPDARLTDENTNRDERSTELYVRDAIAIGEQTTAWGGLRHTRLTRESIRTDGSRPTDYGQSFTTPWLAVSYAFAPEQLVYASWGKGVESEVAPNRPRYTNRGEALPALKSRQLEVGLKGSAERFEWNLAWFDIKRPLFVDIGNCDVDNSCARLADGSAHHRGFEASGTVRDGAWTVQAGTQWLRARVEDSATPSNNGLEPTNVPALTLKLQATYAVPAIKGLMVQGKVAYEGRRMVLPDNSASVPGYTRVDAIARYETPLAGKLWTWRAGIDNLFDQRAWREAPYQFGHAYLFPLAPRSLRLSVQVGI